MSVIDVFSRRHKIFFNFKANVIILIVDGGRDGSRLVVHKEH